jgi:hypothetical protein
MLHPCPLPHPAFYGAGLGDGSLQPPLLNDVRPIPYPAGATFGALALGRFVFLPFHRASLAKAGMPTQNGQTHFAAGDRLAEEVSVAVKATGSAPCLPGPLCVLLLCTTDLVESRQLKFSAYLPVRTTAGFLHPQDQRPVRL